jgi:small subunit ribosomal protein S17
MPQTITGIVSSDKGDKTIVVTVATRKTHPLYGKQYTVNTRFMAHDETNQAKVGDRVTIVACRPLSARKRFNLSKIVERGGIGFEETDATADIPVEDPAEAKPPKAVKPKAGAKTEEKAV